MKPLTKHFNDHFANNIGDTSNENCPVEFTITKFLCSDVSHELNST